MPARCRHLWLTSKQHLGVHFNPAGLLSFGDALAFANAVRGPMPNYDAVAGAVGSGDGSRLAASEAAPEMQEQMAQRGSITSRVPQKYLIQNQSGLRVYYWAGPVRRPPLYSLPTCSVLCFKGHAYRFASLIGIPRALLLVTLLRAMSAPRIAPVFCVHGSCAGSEAEYDLQSSQLCLEACLLWQEHKGAGRGPVRTHSLDTGVSETLKVTPQRKVLQHVTPGRGGIGKLQNVINLHFEGNWMPIKATLLAARLLLCPTALCPCVSSFFLHGQL